ncbi:MAG: bacillithiol biosynthesis cysteine-adding enzyme BshC [Bacteroidetes bacterium]|nr:bacillithiol biosynthesis cysteine-adding enzyme BshC [Bacteroidota bacterium]
MDWISTYLPYRQTGYFSRIITDYLEQAAELAPFYAHPVTTEGLKAAIEARRKAPVNRPVLVEALREQYASVSPAPLVEQNIARLADENTFTIVTAHQPAIFTGHLYFIYKILHTIRLAEQLTKETPGAHFVPVFYMGSEDADLDELGNVYLGGEKLVWDTKQTGAVGRMKTKGLDRLLFRIEGELSVQPYGNELLAMLREAYLESPDIQTATFRLLHRLFAEYGLIVLIPDRADLKKLMIPVFEDDLFQQTPSAIVEKTIGQLSAHYKVQANPRLINLFYLKDDIRNRIEEVDGSYVVHGTNIRWTPAEIKEELHRHPERFSPNVILRGLFQETILPNVAFIGGGGETAYWLELKGLFDHYKTPFPVLVLRNSFLLVEKQWQEKIEKMGFEVTDIFQPAEDLMNQLVRRDSEQTLSLEEEIAAANRYYESLKNLARPVDPTLEQHVTALQTRAVEPLRVLEKKLLKAEKRKFDDQRRQLQTLKTALFPHDGLQERVENFMPWYAQHGQAFIHHLYKHSPALEQSFVILYM